MEERKNNAKCPFCGKELTVALKSGEGFCPYCKKEFDVEKAIKLYNSLNKEEQEEEKKVARGEDYLEVDKMLERAEFYFDRKDYDGAKKELLLALELTNSDYRVYFGLVRAETKNLTDYKNVTHKQWLDKAIDCASAEEKSVITRLYKDFYQLSALSDDEIEQYKKEENAAKKQKLEGKLKESIPVYMKLAKTLKQFLIWGIVALILGVGCAAAGALIPSNYLALGGLALAVGGYVLVRTYVTRNEQNKLFNAALDLYDALDGFSMKSDNMRDLLDIMKKLSVAFGNKNATRETENLLGTAAGIMLDDGDQSARAFVISNDVLLKIAKSVREEV